MKSSVMSSSVTFMASSYSGFSWLTARLLQLGYVLGGTLQVAVLRAPDTRLGTDQVKFAQPDHRVAAIRQLRHVARPGVVVELGHADERPAILRDAVGVEHVVAVEYREGLFHALVFLDGQYVGAEVERRVDVFAPLVEREGERSSAGSL